MSSTYTIRDALAEQRIFLSRAVFIFVFALVLMLGLTVRLVYLQIVGHQHYASLAKKNRIKIAPIPPTRGIIYDRKGRVLAQNLPSYSLEIIPEQVKDMDDTLSRLQELLNIPEEKIEDFKKQKERHKRFDSVPLLLNLSVEEVAKFAVQRPFFPGVDINALLVRYYPYDILTAHVVGYVGRINEQELKDLPEEEYNGTFYVGKVGIEATYEDILHGKAGYMEVETNAQGRAINVLSQVDSQSGANLYLSLDIDLQKTAYEALAGYNGALVAIDIESGDVVAMASRPSFDPNPFVQGISSKAYKELIESEDRPMINRSVAGLYPPGSTVKPFMGLAGLEYGVIDRGRSLYCPGYYQLPGVKHKFRDWAKWGHGSVDLNEAITQSCDVYFYKLALDLGIDKVHSFMQKFGFGEKTGIDLKGEQSGVFPSREWKRKTKKESWVLGDSVITGIGQGYILTTPLQLARATATLANRGKVVTPYLVDRIAYPDRVESGPVQSGEVIPLNQEYIDQVIAAMINVVHGKRGTAKKISEGLQYQLAGKTGTAQVFTVKQNQSYNKNKLDEKLHDHALFISFAPADNPKIAVAVVVENGGHGGSTAAPMAVKVINQFLGYPNPTTPPAEINENRNPQ